MYINESWSFKEIVDNLKMLRKKYREFLAFFLLCDLEPKIVNIFVKNIRDKIYKLNIKDWQKDMIWEYMNGDRFFRDLRRIYRQIDKKQ